MNPVNQVEIIKEGRKVRVGKTDLHWYLNDGWKLANSAEEDAKEVKDAVDDKDVNEVKEAVEAPKVPEAPAEEKPAEEKPAGEILPE